jgi:AcrR family transcriptional regulator
MADNVASLSTKSDEFQEMSSVARHDGAVSAAQQIRAASRAEARAQLREAILDAAYAEALASGWARVRVGAVAAAVGISRQTLYQQYGTKEALGQALVLREAEDFMSGVMTVLQRHSDDPADAVAAACQDALARLAEHPLLQATLAAPDGDGLLPQVTSRSRPLLDRAGAAVAQWSADQRPDVPLQRHREIAELLVRLVISYALLPGDEPRRVGVRLGRLYRSGIAVA